MVDDKGRVVADAPAPLGGASPDGAQPLPAPLGAGLFGDVVDDATLPRSDQSVMRPVNRSDKAGGRLLGTVTISNAPAYGQVALRNVVQAWALASLLGIAVAALVGLLVSAWLLRPLRELTDASDRMSHGDLGVRADVDRADEVGRLAASFNAMAERVEETVTSLRRFAADAAHGLGTPLTALQADLELAEGHAQTDDERRLLERATAQAERLGDISTGLLRLSRLETGDVATDPERLDLAALARHVADAFASRADQAEIELRLDVPDGEVPVVGHPDGLRTADRGPPRQRAEVHAGGRHGDARAAHRRPPGPPARLGHRHRHPGRRPPAPLRAIPPRRERIPVCRQRSGPRDRPGDGGDRRGDDPGRERRVGLRPSR